MRIEIRNDSVIIDGYVNAVLRDSKPIPRPGGKFVEQIMPKAFERALGKALNVDILLNHNKTRKLGSTVDGNLELFEDNIGLRAIATITDAEVMEKARKKELRGWSFGFYSDKDKWEDVGEGLQRRFVEELELTEVSIIDNTRMPAYIGTSIETRDDKEVTVETREEDSKAITEDISVKEEKREEVKIDYSIQENEIQILKMKGGK
ncbi:HK97 family phage prohead protease [Clostridium sp.]|jgi:HK97 family phage prohead protease|uniref:HK97 family phage prohead protease n=1 Tax=Clostridium sp. TaxID=1506 RepID=UPI003EEDA2FD